MLRVNAMGLIAKAVLAGIAGVSLVLGLLAPLPSAVAAEGTWSTLGLSNWTSAPRVIETDSAGNVYVTSDGQIGSIKYLAMWNGTQWSRLGCNDLGTYGAASDLDAGIAGDLYVAATVNCNGVYAQYVAKWDGLNWSALGSGPGGTANEVAYDSTRNVVYVWRNYGWGGGGTIGLYRLSKWDGLNWSDIPNTEGISDTVTSMATDASGNLYLGGNFTSFGGIAANYMAKFDGTTWSAMGS